MFHSHGMRSGGEIRGIGQCHLIFEESPTTQHDCSLDNAPSHEEDNEQEIGADHVTLNVTKSMLLQSLKKVTNEQRKHINDLSHSILVAMEFSKKTKKSLGIPQSAIHQGNFQVCFFYMWPNNSFPLRTILTIIFCCNIR